MQKFRTILRAGILYTFAFILIFGQPISVYADEPKESPSDYTYNDQSGHWESEKWIWDESTQSYTARPVTTPPAETTTTEDSAGENVNNSSSPTTVDSGIDNSTSTNVTTDATINNGLDSISESGNAGVKSNTKAGSSKSGDANADATVINTVHSTIQGDNAGVAHFTADIEGNVNGDITLFPADASVNSKIGNSSKINVNQNNQIYNDLDLAATSGNAAVDGNTSAGSATSGNANTVVNLVNLINSIIAANQSFVGTINIHGNLNGDILISPEFIPQLLASNGGSVSGETSNELNANLNHNDIIENNISLAANSGDATVAGNTNAGSAHTGTGQTNLTVLNLTGREIVAEKCVLVFINVLGKWVGVIANAPEGSTAAALGSGVVKNEVTNTSEINSNTNNKIKNDVNLASKSGDASVTNNTKAGDATSGNATASANILNMSMSTLQLSNWFGILFINVFGEWHGSFGIDTENGNLIPISNAAAANASGDSGLRFGFAPTETKSTVFGGFGRDQSETQIEEAKATLAAMKFSGDEQPDVDFATNMPTIVDDGKSENSLPFMITMGTMAGVPVLALATLLRRRLGF